MARCAKCNKLILVGGLKHSDMTFCKSVCAAQAFMPRFEDALGRAASQPPVFAPRAPQPRTVPAPPPFDDEPAPSLVETGKDLIVPLIGVAGTLAVAALIYAVLQVVKYPFHALTFWFVIPLGAFFCGMLAGVGFWTALRQYNRLPTPLTYIVAALAGAFSYIFIYVLMWYLMEDNGLKIRNQIGFLDFLQVVVENQKIRVGRGNGAPIELGKWGYARFAINTIGYALGVTTMVGIGGGIPYCPKCRRYYAPVTSHRRSSSDPEAAGFALFPVIYSLQSGRIQEALDHHHEAGISGHDDYLKTTLKVDACPECGKHIARLTASLAGERGPEPITGFAFAGECDGPVEIPA